MSRCAFRKVASRAAVALALLACAGCAASSSHSHVAEIELGITSQQQIHSWFGEPDTRRVEPEGVAKWGYQRDIEPGFWHDVGRELNRWVFHPVASFMDSFLLYPPQPESARVRSADILAVSFGPDGLVSEYSYRRIR